MAIGDWIRDPIAGHSHGIAIPLGPERALAHALSVPVAPDRTVRTLFRLRGLNPNGSLETFFTSSGPGFQVLERRPTEFTSGIATRIWPPGGERPVIGDPTEWADWDEVPGSIKAVGTFRTRGSDRDWSELTTETRVSASDPQAARAFRAYWLAVGPASSMIRRRWLRAMAARARAVR
jgi:hypothetical protein